MTHYKENLEFLSDEFVESLNVLLEKLNQNGDILLENDRLIEIAVKSIPKLFDNFHVNKIRKFIMKIIFKLTLLSKNTENIFELIKKVHFHNNEGLLFCYTLTQMNISTTTDSYTKFILNNIKLTLDNSPEYSMIISLINILNNQSHSNEIKKIVFEILSEISTKTKFKFSNINLLFNFSKTRAIEKEFSCGETHKLLKSITENSKEIMFDKVFIL